MNTVMDKEVQAAFETVCRLSPVARAAWFEQHETVASVRHEVEELLRYDGLAEQEAFFAPRPAASELDSLLGTQVGPYEVISMIGRGGMGSVYLARRRVPYEQDVALKVADLRLGSGAARFDEERQVLADLHHPGIAKLLDGDVLDDDRPYLVMEYVPGLHIDVFAENHKLRVMERVQLWLKVCEAVASAHERGIIHRDLKPSNILVTAESRVVVVDFGLARRWEQDSGLTRTATVLGTPEYMAPEQATGKRLQTTPATDVYALGAVLYTLLTGRPPFRAESPLQLVTIMLNDDPVSPRRLNPAVPRDLETICLKCLEKEPGRRYATATELTADVQRLQRGEAIQARSIGMAGWGWRWARRRPLVASVIGFLLITILTSLIIVANYWRKAHTALELAKQASRKLFDYTFAIKNQPAMQRPQVELLTQTIESYGQLVQSLEDEQLTLLYFHARRELIYSKHWMGGYAGITQEAEDLMKEVDEFAQSHPSDEAFLELAFSISLLAGTMENPVRVKELQTRVVMILTAVIKHQPHKDSYKGLLAEKLQSLAHREFVLGLVQDSEKHFQEALKLLEQLYQKYPIDDPQIRMRLCSCLQDMWEDLYHAQGKWAEGSNLIERASQLDLSLLKDFPKVIDHRQSTLRATWQLACFQEWKGDWSAAYQTASQLADVCEQLTKHFPDVIRHYQNNAELQKYLGELAHALGNNQKARDHFRKSFANYQAQLARSSVDYVLLSALAHFYSDCPLDDLRENGKALELARKAFQINSQSRHASLALGKAQMRSGQLPAAETTLKNTLLLEITDDEMATIQIYLALTYAKMGQLDKAKEAYAATEKYITRYPKEVVMVRLRNEAQQLLNHK